jgi:hypothetical protein
MIEVTKDGRTKRTGKDYTEFRLALYKLQSARCFQCGRWTFLLHPIEWDDSFHVDHADGRGIGGSKRDDTFRACHGLCGKCHRIKHHQQVK